jgi:hypothetical protein
MVSLPVIPFVGMAPANQLLPFLATADARWYAT